MTKSESMTENKIVHLDKPGVAERLVSDGKLSSADLERARQVNEKGSNALGPLLVRLGLVSDRDLAQAYVDMSDYSLMQESEIPEIPLEDCPLSVKFLKESYVVPLSEDEEQLSVALANPEDKFILRAIEMATGKDIHISITTISQIERALEQLYDQAQASMSDIIEEIDADDDVHGVDSIERLRDLAAEAPIVRLVSMIINRAIELRASDIHIEPFENRLKVRCRIDGVLQEVEAPPARSTAAVISRVKIMAKLNIAERRLPQDGRIQLRVQGKLIDLRVSTVPTLHGESLVLRILDKQRLALDLDILGFDGTLREKFERCLALPRGIILVTGPTGSGKTTTLYAALQILNTPEKKILTVEDPVEYQLEGINQIQVKPQINLNFADALRSIVRQDPDVIMIGEMRDLETARIAVQSALTGHLVFSTLHTNDAGSSLTRLLDMGVEDYLLTSTLNGILAQRLVRSVCQHCKEAYEPLPQLVEELGFAELSNENSYTLYKAVGCEECGHTGYMGRSVITEFLVLSENIRQLILSHADGASLQKAAMAEGMLSMKMDGLSKALKGITTIEEVSRVTQE